ncbi:hypothetical protein SARC_11723 [Sphaeroforma arctica JP610]|uniref:Tryptophan synthase beta chain-like PALP domain-containing protein n=1 Tax=Sphaeroforma arctica JP610 TaxID=667725 RepID=A0A0L0FG74_9EUKA|nr:hypothetical protein SARC_11723 [Sphaeroforma arctica JP610]KNC75760.1 hypothetical protein SARC_11723 [Sphaeroforma arctica JP610]|eukprot:XP_014149662.1 hypothetical protein SARC_11723 [Sphaeroforma arctica JP610]
MRNHILPHLYPNHLHTHPSSAGVIGYEIYKHLPSVDVCIVPCGGGGLISGVSGYLKAVKPSVQMIGAQPQASPQMVESVKAGRIVNLPTLDTLSNGTAGGIEEGSITFPYCQKYVDEWEAVTETEISTAVYDVLDRHHKVIEGAAGCGIATVHRKAKQLTGKTVVVVVCGSNISPAALSKIIADNAPVGYI